MALERKPEPKSRTLGVQSSRMGPDVALRVIEVETEVDEHALARALALLARWACRRGGKALGGGEMPCQNLVTADVTKGYGAEGVDN